MQSSQTRRRLFSSLVVGIISLHAFSQSIPANDQPLAARYPFVSTLFNRIFNSGGLTVFLQKLKALEDTKTGQVSIVHIGDSHIQAGIITAVVRDGLQDFFGNAGRGLVFPYQLAQSNAPDDINASSNTSWQFNRLAHPEIPLPFGISGFGINTNTGNASIDLSLGLSNMGTQSFDRIKLFFDPVDSAQWILTSNAGDTLNFQSNQHGDSFHLSRQATGFRLQSDASTGRKTLYGISLENSQPGLLYHTIGVNGARYDQFNNAGRFWQQLPELKADLFIVSLGTNEAQRDAFSEAAFYRELDQFFANLQQASPAAAILVTTAPDSYKGRSSNRVLQLLNQSLEKYCNNHFLPFWDLYRITNGYGSAYSWAKRGLMSRDRIHFTAEGYRLQGNLLMSAIAKTYNDMIKK